jgi:tRNA(His) 5'-end guanylyltransferase
MSRYDSLGDRMKGYENISRHYLMRRTPVVIRLDGKAFHSYTKNLDKPYSEALHTIRQEVLERLCKSLQGAVIGYAQSDELSIILKDWQSLETSAWFDNNLQKIVSVTSSMCTANWNYLAHWKNLTTKLAMFDCRAFNIPKEEVANYLLWRQQDWERNSIQMLAQSLYSHKQLQNKSCAQLVTMFEQEHGIVWGNLESWKKQGEWWVDGELIEGDFLVKNNRELLDGIMA